ncbi:MAG: tetratricopeptide (TPR) repeat protein, partial [Pseudoalteromonas tetraodonis]
AAVYQGLVTPEQLATDRKICGVGSGEILSAAVPFAGRWKYPPAGLVPRTFAVELAEEGMLEEARAYLHQLLPLYEGKADARGELAECERFLGAIAQDDKDYALALRHYERSLELVPSQRLVRDELMRMFVEQGDLRKAAEQLEAILADRRDDFESLAQLGKFRTKLGEVDEAIAHYRESLALQSHPETHSELAGLLRDQGKAAEAMPHYRAVLEARPEDPLAANNLAWVLATHPAEAQRNGKEAVRLAERACEITGEKIPPLLGTLAAAHAEAGEFEKAVAVGRRAVEAAREFSKEEMATRLEERLKLYRAGKAYRDPTMIPTDG